ncbi:MAG: vWA domain-containing protein [Nanoarchaeota archaeon]
MKKEVFKKEFLLCTILVLVIMSFFAGSIKAESYCDVDIDVVLIQDVSGSMESNNKLYLAKIASINFTSRLESGDQSSLVTFGGTALLKKNLSNNHALTMANINQLSDGGNTAGGDAIRFANNELNSTRANPTHKKIGILLSDGEFNSGICTPTCSEYAKAQSRIAKSMNITIFTIGFGSDADAVTLQNISNTTRGKYYFSPNGSMLNIIYQEIGQEICSCTVNNDCPPKSECINEECVANAKTYWADQSSPNNTITHITALVNSTKVLAMIKNAKVGEGITEQVVLTFKIKEKDALSSDDIKTVSVNSDTGLIKDGNYSWTITSDDLAKTPSDYSQFYFEVYYGAQFINQSDYLDITPVFPINPVNLCSDYNIENECTVNAGGIDFRNINSTCGTSTEVLGCLNTIDCSCKWDTSTCLFNMKTTTDYNCALVGGVECAIDSSTADDCTDSILYYTETNKFAWDADNSFDCPSEITGFLGITDCNDDTLFQAEGKYHYDPMNVLDSCVLGENTEKIVVCPVQTSIPFFGYYNLIAVIVIASIVYIFIILSRNKKIAKKK